MNVRCWPGLGLVGVLLGLMSTLAGAQPPATSHPGWRAKNRLFVGTCYQPFDRTFNMEFGYWQENYEQWSIFTRNGVTNEDEANRFFSFDDRLNRAAQRLARTLERQS